MSEQQYRGRVENKQIHLLGGEGDRIVRLTAMSMAAAMTPESHEVDLTSYEGQTISVTGYLSGDWLYSARIADGRITSRPVRMLQI